MPCPAGGVRDNGRGEQSGTPARIPEGTGRVDSRRGRVDASRVGSTQIWSGRRTSCWVDANWLGRRSQGWVDARPEKACRTLKAMCFCSFSLRVSKLRVRDWSTQTWLGRRKSDWVDANLIGSTQIWLGRRKFGWVDANSVGSTQI